MIIVLGFLKNFFQYLKNSSGLFSVNYVENWGSLQHFLIIEKFGLETMVQKAGTIQSFCIQEYETGLLVSGVAWEG